MSDISRRELLITLSTVHAAVAAQKKAAHGVYQSKRFTTAEYATLRKLCDLIIPADEHSPGALDAGAPEFIDFLASRSDELARIYTGGLAWLDHEMKGRYSARFVEATPEQQAAMLDLIAFTKNDSPALGPGIRFFAWLRNMTADAYYTSKAGMDDLGYMGNGAMSQFSVPAEAIEYALKRSGLA